MSKIRRVSLLLAVAAMVVAAISGLALAAVIHSILLLDLAVFTGFLVFNEKTYPNLIAMFEQLGVASVETEMSFAVSLENPHLEWAGSSLATGFGQKRNLLRPGFWSMLSDILRFNRQASALTDAQLPAAMTLLGEWNWWLPRPLAFLARRPEHEVSPRGPAADGQLAGVGG